MILKNALHWVYNMKYCPRRIFRWLCEKLKHKVIWPFWASQFPYLKNGWWNKKSELLYQVMHMCFLNLCNPERPVVMVVHRLGDSNPGHFYCPLLCMIAKKNRSNRKYLAPTTEVEWMAAAVITTKTVNTDNTATAKMQHLKQIISTVPSSSTMLWSQHIKYSLFKGAPRKSVAVT